MYKQISRDYFCKKHKKSHFTLSISLIKKYKWIILLANWKTAVLTYTWKVTFSVDVARLTLKAHKADFKSTVSCLHGCCGGKRAVLNKKHGGFYLLYFPALSLASLDVILPSDWNFTLSPRERTFLCPPHWTFQGMTFAFIPSALLLMIFHVFITCN